MKGLKRSRDLIDGDGDDVMVSDDGEDGEDGGVELNDKRARIEA